MNAVPSGRPHQCLDDTQLLELAAGKYPQAHVQELLEQAEPCSVCQILLREVGRAVAETKGDITAVASRAKGCRSFEVGELISDRYRIESLLGYGGMGEVYQVLDEELGERVALKTLRKRFGHRSGVDRLRQELRLARSLIHPNLCRVLEFGRHSPRSQQLEAEPSYYFTMELLAGHSLSQLLNRDGPFEPERALYVVGQLCDGLDTMHRSGILHRDIKTSNVMLCPGQGSAREPRTVLLDFGIARSLLDAPDSQPESAPIARSLVPDGTCPASDRVHARRLTDSDHRVGTPLYMAPEQHLPGARLSPATDLFAVGVVMFELLTGRLPPRAETPHDDERTRRAALEACRGTSKGIAAALTRCLAYDPAARPRSAAELREQLHPLPPVSRAVLDASTAGSLALAAY